MVPGEPHVIRATASGQGATAGGHGVISDLHLDAELAGFASGQPSPDIQVIEILVGTEPVPALRGPHKIPRDHRTGGTCVVMGEVEQIPAPAGGSRARVNRQAAGARNAVVPRHAMPIGTAITTATVAQTHIGETVRGAGVHASARAIAEVGRVLDGARAGLGDTLGARGPVSAVAGAVTVCQRTATALG